MVFDIVEIIAIFSNNAQRRISAKTEKRCVEIAEIIAKKCKLDFVDHYVVK